MIPLKPVVMYTTPTCTYCNLAKQIFRRVGLGPDHIKEIDVSASDELKTEMVRLSGGGKTVPQIFIGEYHIGGATELQKLFTEGKLVGVLNGTEDPT